MIRIYIDNNVWDFLFERSIDLSVEFPNHTYCLCMTREAEFEIPPIPDSKADLKVFIEDTISRCVMTDFLFGFRDERHTAEDQRYGGFDQGRWASEQEIAFFRQQHTKIGSNKKKATRLYPQEADISLAARSFESIVLTLDAKKGPINTAYQQGGRVIFLKGLDESNLSLRGYVEHEIAACPS